MTRLIDADAFANRIVSVYGEDGLPKDASLIYELLLNRPTIDAEPVKHGKWVRLEIKGIINPLTGKNRTYTGCSCCGEPIPTDSILDIIPEEEVNFCFGCGAKMDKGKEDDK